MNRIFLPDDSEFRLRTVQWAVTLPLSWQRCYGWSDWPIQRQFYYSSASLHHFEFPLSTLFSSSCYATVPKCLRRYWWVHTNQLPFFSSFPNNDFKMSFVLIRRLGNFFYSYINRMKFQCYMGKPNWYFKNFLFTTIKTTELIADCNR